MVKHRKILYILGVTFVSFIVFSLLCLWITKHFLQRHFANSYVMQELPTQSIELEFKRMTGYDLPETKERLRAIYESGREPIFVCFHTDDKGILYIKDIFSKRNGMEFRPIEPHVLKANGISNLFSILLIWRKYHGEESFDLGPVASAIKCDYSSLRDLGYRIIIDTEKNNVFIEAFYN